MADQIAEKHPLLKRPLYLYDLPPELLLTLTVRNDDGRSLVSSDEISKTSTSDIPIEPTGETSTTTSCTLCQVSFPNVQDQRQHVRSDFHRYNLKLSIKGSKPVSESTFIKLVGDLDESISGSDSSESEEDEDDAKNPGDTTLTALLKRQAKFSQQEDDSFSTTRRKPVAGKAPLIWMSSSIFGNDVALGVYRAMLSAVEQEEVHLHLVDIIKRKQLTSSRAKHSGNGAVQGPQSGITPHLQNAKNPHIFLCMIGGGHFAASIISLAAEVRKGRGGVEEPVAVVKAHKTFHRYTTRRKQGGSQSANDNAKGNAHSAGSSIRRYNEAALETDIRNLLVEWKSMIDEAELLFVRASGTTSRRTLFGPYDGQVLSRTDKRLRGFPFSTRRATQKELTLAFVKLTRLQVSNMTEVTLETATASQLPTTKPPKPKVVAAPKPTKEEETALLHTSQLQALIRRSKAPGILLYLNKNELSPDYELYPPDQHHHSPRLLHLAASTNSPALIVALITKARSDPTIPNGDGKTPYDLAGDTKTRDAFRIARHTLGETAFDWSAAHIPSALSPEAANAKAQSEKAAETTAEAERRKADLDRIRAEEEQARVGKIEKKAGVGRSLLADEKKTGAEKREEEARGLTPEMRARLERERRARAAEERMKRSG